MHLFPRLLGLFPSPKSNDKSGSSQRSLGSHSHIRSHISSLHSFPLPSTNKLTNSLKYLSLIGKNSILIKQPLWQGTYHNA